MKFERTIGSTADHWPINFQSGLVFFALNLVASKLYEILRCTSYLILKPPLVIMGNLPIYYSWPVFTAMLKHLIQSPLNRSHEGSIPWEPCPYSRVPFPYTDLLSRYRDCHYDDEKLAKPYYLNNGNFQVGKAAILHCSSPRPSARIDNYGGDIHLFTQTIWHWILTYIFIYTTYWILIYW